MTGDNGRYSWSGFAQTVGVGALTGGIFGGAGYGVATGLSRVTALNSTRTLATNTAGKSDFIASADGVVVPTSRGRLVAGFEEARLPSSPTTSAGTQYSLPDGSLVRVMEPSGQAELRASFTNANGGPIDPFTGKPVQPPPGLPKPERLDYIRSRTHIELEP